MKVRIQLITLLFFIPYLILAQSEFESRTVISTTGLNVRQSPSLQGKKLFALPFEAQVDLLERDSTSYDTIGSHKYDLGPYQKFEIQVEGYWVRIRHNGKTGWVFEPYLSWMPPYVFQDTSLQDSNYALYNIGYDCGYNFVYNPKMNYYGVYENGKGYALFPVSLSFFTILTEDGELTPFVISANNNTRLLFVIGSQKKLSEGNIEGKSYNDFSDDPYKTDPRFSVKTKDYNSILTLKENGEEQILNPLFGGYYNSPFSYPTWIGDLDGDGKSDYIIWFGEKTSTQVLFLSSEAREGEIVRPVAVYYSGYCC